MIKWQVSIFFGFFVVNQIQAATHVGGVLYHNTIWGNVGSANTYYLIKDVQIPKNVTLTIFEGVKISFALGDFEILVKGRLEIVGKFYDPVIFQGGSVRDKKWMIKFQSTQLSLILISFAHFIGPKKALQTSDVPDGIQENNGTLIIQSCTFSDNTAVSANGAYPRSSNPSVPALQFEYCTFNKTTVSSIGADSEPITIDGSEILDTTFYPRASNEGIKINNCSLIGTTIIFDLSGSENIIRLKYSEVKEISLLVLISSYITYQFYVTNCIIQDFVINSMYYAGSWLYHTIVSFEQSTITNFSTNFPSSSAGSQIKYYQLLIRNCSYTNSILNFNYINEPLYILIENSVLQNVNIIGKRTDSSTDYVPMSSRRLTMRYVRFIDGAIIFTHGQTEISYSHITLAAPPLALNGSCTITCTSISRSNSIQQQNTTGVSAKHLYLVKSTIENFAVGLQIALTSVYTVNILQTNFIGNSEYNIENRGPYNIIVSNIYWGTNNSEIIHAKIIDYWDNINYGYVISTNDALSPLSVEADCTATTTIAIPVETGTDMTYTHLSTFQNF